MASTKKKATPIRSAGFPVSFLQENERTGILQHILSLICTDKCISSDFEVIAQDTASNGRIVFTPPARYEQEGHLELKFSSHITSFLLCTHTESREMLQAHRQEDIFGSRYTNLDELLCQRFSYHPQGAYLCACY